MGKYNLLLPIGMLVLVLVLGGPASGYHRSSYIQVSVPSCKGDFQSPNSAPGREEGERKLGLTL